jgi:hypothetical protein
MQDPIEELGRLMYEAYRKRISREKTYEMMVLPVWEDVPQAFREALFEGVEVVRNQVLADAFGGQPLDQR